MQREDNRLTDDEIADLIGNILRRERTAAAAAGRLLRITSMLASALTGTDRIDFAATMRGHAEALGDEQTRRRHAVH